MAELDARQICALTGENSLIVPIAFHVARFLGVVLPDLGEVRRKLGADAEWPRHRASDRPVYRAGRADRQPEHARGSNEINGLQCPGEASVRSCKYLIVLIGYLCITDAG
jgi:hypothetical protein